MSPRISRSSSGSIRSAARKCCAPGHAEDRGERLVQLVGEGAGELAEQRHAREVSELQALLLRLELCAALGGDVLGRSSKAAGEQQPGTDMAMRKNWTERAFSSVEAGDEGLRRAWRPDCEQHEHEDRGARTPGAEAHRAPQQQRQRA